MKRAELYHPRVFEDREWALGYYERNHKNIRRVGKRFAKILQSAGFKKGKIFDAGCGFGAVALELATTFPEVEIHGIDLGTPLLDMAASALDQAGVSDRVHLRRGDVQSIEVEDASFDIVVCTFMVHIVDDPVAMLNGIERICKPGGKILITDLRRCWLGWFVRKLKTALTLEEGEAIIRRSKLRPGKGSKGPFWWDYMVGL